MIKSVLCNLLILILQIQVHEKVVGSKHIPFDVIVLHFGTR